MAEMTLGAHFLAWLPTSQYAWILSVLPAARVLEVAGMGTHQPPGPDEDIAGRYVVHRLGHEPMGSYAGIAIAPIKLPNGDRYWRVVFKRPDGYYRMVHIPPNLLVVGEPVTPEALRLAVLRHDGNLEAAQAEIGNARTTGIAAAIQEAAKPTPTAELRSLRVVKAGCPCLVGLSLYDAHFGNLEGAAAFLARVSATYVAHDRPYPPEVVLDVTWDVDGYLRSKLLPVELGHEWLWADAGAGFLSLLGAETGQVFHAPDHHGAVYYDHLGRWLQFMATSGEDWSERTRLITSIMGLGSGVAKVMGHEEHRNRARVEDGQRVVLDLVPLAGLQDLWAGLRYTPPQPAATALSWEAARSLAAARLPGLLSAGPLRVGTEGQGDLFIWIPDAKQRLMPKSSLGLEGVVAQQIYMPDQPPGYWLRLALAAPTEETWTAAARHAMRLAVSLGLSGAPTDAVPEPEVRGGDEPPETMPPATRPSSRPSGPAEYKSPFTVQEILAEPGVAQAVKAWRPDSGESGALALVQMLFNAARSRTAALHFFVDRLTYRASKGLVPVVEYAVPASDGAAASPVHHTLAVAVREATGGALLYMPTFGVVERLHTAVVEYLEATVGTSRRVDAVAIEGILTAFLDWVDAQPDGAALREALPVVQGELEGWIGDALLWVLLNQNAKVYKVKRPLAPGDPVALSAFVLGESLDRSGALEVGPSGALIRVPSVADVGATTAEVMYSVGTTPTEVRGVPGHKLADLLHERVDLSALSGPTRTYLRAYLREFIEDDAADADEPDVEARLSVIAAAIRDLPLTRGGLMGLEDLRERAMTLAGSGWVGHPVAVAVATKRAQIERALQAPEVVEAPTEAETADGLPGWAKGLIATAKGPILRSRLEHHGQGALRYAGARLARDRSLTLAWEGGGRTLRVVVMTSGATTYTATGTFQTADGVRVDQPRWTFRVNREAAGLLPDAWLDQIRDVAPAQVAQIEYAALGLTDAQDREVRGMLQHAAQRGYSSPVLRLDEHRRVFVTTTIDGAASTVVIPPSGRGFPWPPLAAVPGKIVGLPRAQVTEALPATKAKPPKAEIDPPAPWGYTRIGSYPVVDHADVDVIGWQRHIRAKDWSRAEREVYRDLKALGYQLQSQLGCGQYGCAYLGRPYVVKITGDPLEVANAHVVSTQAEMPGVAKIYAAFAFSGTPKLYAIIMEVLEAPSRAVKAWVTKYRVDWWRRELERGATGFTRKQYEDIREAARAAAPKGVNVSDYLDAIDGLYTLGIFYQEGHEDNVMVRVDPDGSRTLVAIDLGFSATPGAAIPNVPEAA